MITQSAYRPAWWLPGPHLMTMVPALLRRLPPLETRRERFTLPDGDFVDLEWGPEPETADAPLLLLLHGLEGSIDSRYIRGMLLMAARRGWRGVLMHFRGCSGAPNLRARAYHSGETGDLGVVATSLAARFPHVSRFAVGFSLGANVLLKYLGERGAESTFSRAVAVSVPMMLAPCADRLRRGASRIYDRWLLHSLKASVARKAACMALPLDLDAVRRARSLRAFDDAVTAPLHGFEGADDYYARSSSRPFLGRIEIPTLILQARDDPFMTDAVLPRPEELSPSVTLELSARGGHVGFVGGRNPFAPVWWVEARAGAFLADDQVE